MMRSCRHMTGSFINQKHFWGNICKIIYKTSAQLTLVHIKDDVENNNYLAILNASLENFPVNKVINAKIIRFVRSVIVNLLLILSK